jgi:hypothetical protein
MAWGWEGEAVEGGEGEQSTRESVRFVSMVRFRLENGVNFAV